MSDTQLSNDQSAERCTARKQGEYNMLRCCRRQGHDGEHCYVLVRTHAYCTDHKPEKRR